MPRKRRIEEEEEEEEDHENDAPVIDEEEMEEQEDDDHNGEEDEIEQEDEEDQGTNVEDPKSPESKRRRSTSPGRSAPRSNNRSRGPAQVGIIQSIYVENFMCHRKLRVDLCRNINFIHGQNGSGKSAILAALQICLGAGARRTHRARNLKGLVRTDHVNQPTHAKLRVTLHNQGEDAYRHDIYGDKITVERTIALKAGFNGYKLFDVNMKEVSRQRRDLDEMLDHLNIQVENPVAILDQEEAKKFLSGKAEDKYKFFMKACELERLDHTYANVVDQLDDCRNAKERLADSMVQEQQRVEVLKKKYDAHRELDKLEMRLASDETKMVWAMWRVARQNLDQAQQKMQEFEAKAAKKREELSQAEQLSQETEGGQDRLSTRVQELSDEAEQLAKQKRDLQTELKSASAPYHQKEQKLKMLKRKEKQARDELQAAQKRLQDALNEIASSNKESEEARLAAKLADAEKELAAAREQDEPLRQQVSDMMKAYEEIEPSVREAKKSAQDKERQHRAIHAKLQELENSSGDVLAMFGPKVRAVKNQIDRRKRDFTGIVVGPIGAYLKIQPGKEQYAPIAEAGLGATTLDRFIVTNNHDRQILQEIRRNAGCHADCGIFQVKDVPRFAVPDPPHGVETVASVLKIDNDLVFNCLVDNSRIDQTALAKDRQKSEQALIVTGANGEKKLRGIIKNVICLPKGDSWDIKNGQQAVFSNERQLRSTIGSDKSAAIVQAKREIQQLETEVSEMRREENRLEAQHSEYQREWNQARKAQRKNDERINALAEKIEQIKVDMDACAGHSIDTTEYEEDVTQQTEAVEKLVDEKQRVTAELDQLKPAMDAIQAKIRETEHQSDKVVQELTTAETEMTKFLETQSQRKDVVARKREKIDKYMQAMKMHAEKVDVIKAEEAKKLHAARKMQFRFLQRKENASAGPLSPAAGVDFEQPSIEDLESIEPIYVEKDVDYYEAKVNRGKDKIEQERKTRKLSNEDPVEAYERYIQAKEACLRKLKDLTELDNTIADYEQDLRSRRKRWKQFRSHLSYKTTEKFQELLWLNRYTGDLIFSHDESGGKLDLMVKKDNGSTSQSSDVKGLSGGERSFTTISLLLALGESLETPFRVMDEFDVFLDPQVRKLTIKTLIFTAKELEHRQFIFITPQDLTGIDPDPQLKIFNLHPPERLNGVGPSQQTLNLSQTS